MSIRITEVALIIEQKVPVSDSLTNSQKILGHNRSDDLHMHAMEYDAVLYEPLKSYLTRAACYVQAKEVGEHHNK